MVSAVASNNGRDDGTCSQIPGKKRRPLGCDTAHWCQAIGRIVRWPITGEPELPRANLPLVGSKKDGAALSPFFTQDEYQGAQCIF